MLVQFFNNSLVFCSRWLEFAFLVSTLTILISSYIDLHSTLIGGALSSVSLVRGAWLSFKSLGK